MSARAHFSGVLTLGRRMQFRACARIPSTCHLLAISERAPAGSRVAGCGEPNERRRTRRSSVRAEVYPAELAKARGIKTHHLKLQWPAIRCERRCQHPVAALGCATAVHACLAWTQRRLSSRSPVIRSKASSRSASTESKYVDSSSELRTRRCSCEFASSAS